MTDDTKDATINTLKAWLADNRQRLLDAGVSFILGGYEGSGDEGRFDELRILSESGLDVDFDLPQESAKLIEELCDAVAPDGYENGDGGGGEVRLSVEAGTIVHRSYYYEVVREENDEEVL